MVPQSVARGSYSLLIITNSDRAVDEVDYSNIPWRSTRFDEEELTNRLAVETRVQNPLAEPEVLTIGDCVCPRTAEEAVLEGLQAGFSI